MKKYNLVLLSILFVLLCILHGRVGAAEDLIGADVPATADQQAVEAATAKAAATKLPPAVQALVDKADAAVAKIDARAKDDAGKLRADLVVALNKAQADATKKGDLALALAIKARVDEQSKLVPEKPKVEVKTDAPVFDIRKATWSGGGGTGAVRDVTDALVSALVARGTVTLETRFFGFDPAPNVGKELVITFVKASGRTTTKTFPENSVITSAMFAP
jgi:ElaB/YqjD/DUF883 family membrane-anchored ribosome-binding protein